MEVFCLFKAQIPAIYIVLQSKRELPLIEVLRIDLVIEGAEHVFLCHVAVGEPVEHCLDWEGLSVVNSQSVFVKG